MGVFCVCVMKEQETEIERQTWRKWGRFLVERHAAGSRLLSPCPMPLECSFVVWTPTRPLFVLRRWGLAECDRALTPEAIRGGGNNTFIPCDASALIPPMFLATNWPRGPPGCAAHLHTNAKKPTVNQLQSQKKKNNNTKLHVQIHKWQFECQIFILFECTVWHLHQGESVMSHKIEKQQRSLLRLI